jgi:hypothetical protein
VDKHTLHTSYCTVDTVRHGWGPILFVIIYYLHRVDFAAMQIGNWKIAQHISPMSAIVYRRMLEQTMKTNFRNQNFGLSFILERSVISYLAKRLPQCSATARVEF